MRDIIEIRLKLYPVLGWYSILVDRMSGIAGGKKQVIKLRAFARFRGLLQLNWRIVRLCHTEARALTSLSNAIDTPTSI